MVLRMDECIKDLGCFISLSHMEVWADITAFLAKMEDSAFQNLSFQIDIDLLCVAFIKLFDLTFVCLLGFEFDSSDTRLGSKCQPSRVSVSDETATRMTLMESVI